MHVKPELRCQRKIGSKGARKVCRGTYVRIRMSDERAAWVARHLDPLPEGEHYRARQCDKCKHVVYEPVCKVRLIDPSNRQPAISQATQRWAKGAGAGNRQISPLAFAR